MKSIRRHLNYANVASTLALVFAMTGGAMAASHYLINSTKQINPKVLARLERGRGPTGPRGPSGPKGEAGAKGETGLQGTNGAEGPSALSPLAPGASESGAYGLGAAASNGEHLVLAVTFQKPLSAPIPVSNVFYTPASTPVPHCSGPSHADPGYLCIYSAVAIGIATPELLDPETDSNLTTGRTGFALTWKTHATKALGEEEADVGTYTVTSP